MTATRRLAAIMAVDVVAYSRLMGEDEVGRRAVPEHGAAARPIVVETRARIVETMGSGPPHVESARRLAALAGRKGSGRLGSRRSIAIESIGPVTYKTSSEA